MPPEIVNKDDFESNFWGRSFRVRLTAQGIEFHVNAACSGDALDEVMDYVVDKGMKGLYYDHEQIMEMDEDYLADLCTAGNNSYFFTTHNIRIEEIPHETVT